MNKKILVIALLALQLGSQVYAQGHSPASMASVEGALQQIRPSDATWSAVAPQTGAVGPDVTIRDIKEHLTLSWGRSKDWYYVIEATDFTSLVAAASDDTNYKSIYAIELATTSSSAATGPTIRYNGLAGTRLVCGLFDKNSRLISPIQNATTRAQILPQPILAGAAATSYSVSAIFSTLSKPPSGEKYYMLCYGYRITSSNQTAEIGLENDGSITITW